ncbi:MAG: MMPL family transporter [Rickettsia endosymbiont of Ixodes persulcatus]|nr:MMPL family transporter [Rickettsia endosymbiont of Ixodes persulcatus]
MYQSIKTILLVLVIIFLKLSTSRNTMTFLNYHELIKLSTFATNLLITLTIAATTDYAIFLIKQYQKTRTINKNQESAYYTMFHNTTHIILNSSITITNATFYLSFTQLPYFQSLNIPLTIKMTITIIMALTLDPTMITITNRFNLLKPKHAMRIHK